ncbi:hypothetical protein BJX76DRAFT_364909 [Aspergillus varians]
MAAHPSSSTTTYLDQPPSCLQFCPASPNNFVVGTYLLTETKSTEPDGLETIQQSKTGSLQLWHLDPETDTLAQKFHRPITAAVFDLHFHPRNPALLAIATSASSISLFTISPETGFTHLCTKTVHEDPSIPALFLAWLPETWLRGPGPAARDGFAVTFSDGRTSVFGLNDLSGNGDDQEQVTELGSFEAKQPIEVWFVAAASYLSCGAAGTEEEAYTPYLFTGNDFGSLHVRRFADTAVKAQGNGDEDGSPLAPLLVNADDRARHHTAGVTSILPLPIPLSHPVCNGEPLLLTGSYDECLRVYHATRGGRVIAESGLGGGVWRLQLLNAAEKGDGEVWTFLVLVSCMHGGTRVVRVTVWGEGEAGIEILVEFTEHESMNYASDVWREGAGDGELGGEGSELRVVSSSFYDRRVCVWRAVV